MPHALNGDFSSRSHGFTAAANTLLKNIPQQKTLRKVLIIIPSQSPKRFYFCWDIMFLINTLRSRFCASSTTSAACILFKRVSCFCLLSSRCACSLAPRAVAAREFRCSASSAGSALTAFSARSICRYSFVPYDDRRVRFPFRPRSSAAAAAPRSPETHKGKSIGFCKGFKLS